MSLHYEIFLHILGITSAVWTKKLDKFKGLRFLSKTTKLILLDSLLQEKDNELRRGVQEQEPGQGRHQRRGLRQGLQCLRIQPAMWIHPWFEPTSGFWQASRLWVEQRQGPAPQQRSILRVQTEQRLGHQICRVPWNRVISSLPEKIVRVLKKFAAVLLGLFV